MNRWICAFAFSVGSTLALAQPARVVHTSAGNALQTSAGKTLYVYDGDEVDRGQQGRSSCTKQCAQEWPPFLAKQGDKATGKWSMITRQDGSKQWAYEGRPLYTFGKASPPGPTAGNGYEGNTWHVAKP